MLNVGGGFFFVNPGSSYHFFLESHIAIDKCTFYIGDVSDHG